MFLLVSLLFLGNKNFSQTWVESGSSPFTNGAVTVRTFYLEQYNGKAITCNGASDAQIKVEVTGSSDYEVTLNSTFQTISNTFPTAFSNLSANLYTISVFDYDNFISVPAEVEVPNVAELIVVNNSNVTKILVYPTCHDQIDGRIRATIAGGTAPYNYEWVGNGSVSTVSNPVGLGSYTFRVTDANLCLTDSTFIVDTPSVILPNPDIASLGCGGGSDGQLTSVPTGGNGGFTYSWNTSPVQTTQTTTATLPTGTYIVTVTDVNLCTASESIVLTPPTPITSSSSETLTLCSNSSDGTSTITVSGGLAPYNLSWTGPAAGNPAGDEIDTDGGNYVISSLAAGSYSVIITDAGGCTESESFTITNPVALSQTNTKTHVTCNGDGNGAINLTVSGGNPPYDISWTGAAIGSQSDAINSSGGSYSIGSLSGGNYDLTITDNNGCILNSNSHTINEPAVLSQTNVSTDVSCNGGINDGQIEVTVTGGTAPYQVSWTGTASGDPIGDEISLDGGDYTIGTLDNGNYLVTVKDANNCQISFPKTIFEPTAI
ncbi:MAG: SprB repeat-containing protein, partial [Flavobacteriales bacterium]|nr:SprB repeat-containing protein [Flavobacteriales bacterium]